MWGKARAKCISIDPRNFSRSTCKASKNSRPRGCSIVVRSPRPLLKQGLEHRQTKTRMKWAERQLASKSLASKNGKNLDTRLVWKNRKMQVRDDLDVLMNRKILILSGVYQPPFVVHDLAFGFVFKMGASPCFLFRAPQARRNVESIKKRVEQIVEVRISVKGSTETIKTGG